MRSSPSTTRRYGCNLVIAFPISTSAIMSLRNAPLRTADTRLKDKPIIVHPIASDPNMTVRDALHSDPPDLVHRSSWQ